MSALQPPILRQHKVVQVDTLCAPYPIVMCEKFGPFQANIPFACLTFNKSWDIATATLTATKLFGYSNEEFTNLTFSDLFADPYMGIHYKLQIGLQQAMPAERVLLKKRDNSNFWATITLVRRTNDLPDGIHCLIEDISRIENLEATLKEKSNELAKVKYELDKFIYSASHEIRSPVSSILGLINLMKLDYTDEKSRSFIELFEVSVRKLERFVAELCTFSENSRRETKSMAVDFYKLLPDVVNRLEADPRLDIRFDLNSTSVFFGDLFRIRLILTNIMKNAFSFHDPQKSNPFVLISLRTEKDKAVIEVIDNGIGISKTHIPNVFDLFYRGSINSKGSGIGLYAAREAAIRIGGTISINSEYGIGTSVRIELPNARKGRIVMHKRELKGN